MPGVGAAILHTLVVVVLAGCTTTGKGHSPLEGQKPSATASSAPASDDLKMAEVAMASSGGSTGPAPSAKSEEHAKKPISMDFVGKGSQGAVPSGALAGGGDAGSLLKAASAKASSEAPPVDQVATARPGLVTVSAPDASDQTTTTVTPEPVSPVAVMSGAPVGAPAATAAGPVQVAPPAAPAIQMPSDPLQQAIASLSAAAGSTVPPPVEPPAPGMLQAAHTAPTDGQRPATAAMLLPRAPPERRIVMITGPGAVELEPRPVRQARPVQAARIVEPKVEPAVTAPPKPPRRF